MLCGALCHVLKQSQFCALAKTRRWTASYLGQTMPTGRTAVRMTAMPPTGRATPSVRSSESALTRRAALERIIPRIDHEPEHRQAGCCRVMGSVVGQGSTRQAPIPGMFPLSGAAEQRGDLPLECSRTVVKLRSERDRIPGTGNGLPRSLPAPRWGSARTIRHLGPSRSSRVRCTGTGSAPIRAFLCSSRGLRQHEICSWLDAPIDQERRRRIFCG